MALSPAPISYAKEEQLRSWGEVQIARMLRRYQIPFQHEHPVAVVEAGKTRIWYPDFQLPEYGIILEYCGRPHDSAYMEGIARKRAAFAANGLTALMFTPDVFTGNWPTRMLDQIEGILVDRVAAFREMRSRSTSRARRRLKV